jgi:c-di-GMP phosphodiesterase
MLRRPQTDLVGTASAGMPRSAWGAPRPPDRVRARGEARLCHLLAGRGSAKDDQKYFTVGLFSLLDVYLDTTMEELLKEMPLSDEIKAALLDHRGKAGSALESAVACERADWDGIRSAKLPAAELQIEQSLLEMKR